MHDLRNQTASSRPPVVSILASRESKKLDVPDLSGFVRLESDNINNVVARGSFGEVRRGILHWCSTRAKPRLVALKTLILRTPSPSAGQVLNTKVCFLARTEKHLFSSSKRSNW